MSRIPPPECEVPDFFHRLLPVVAQIDELFEQGVEIDRLSDLEVDHVFAQEFR